MTACASISLYGYMLISGRECVGFWRSGYDVSKAVFSIIFSFKALEVARACLISNLSSFEK